jgi:hypothetical protein
VAVTNRGVMAEAGYKPKSWLDVAAYGGRTWRSGWEYGAKVTITR